MTIVDPKGNEVHLVFDEYKPDGTGSEIEKKFEKERADRMRDWTMRRLQRENQLLRAEIEARWIPVAERKPEDGVKVLVSVKGRDEALIGWYDADWEDWVVEEDLSEKKLMPVTHWQEKPLPAKDDEE